MLDEQEVAQETLTPESEADTQTATDGEQVNEPTDEEKTKLNELAQNYKIRAEKAEAEAKRLKEKKEEATPKKADKKYSLDEIEDITALSSVPKDDRQEVLDYAERKGIKPSAALDTPFIKSYLMEQKKLRESAQATNTGGGRRGSSQATDEQILKDFAAGKWPETDEAIDRLAEARLNQKLASMGKR